MLVLPWEVDSISVGQSRSPSHHAEKMFEREFTLAESELAIDIAAPVESSLAAD